MKKITKNKITLDAANKSLGRLSAEIAKYLMGKDRADYKRHEYRTTIVEISNIKQLKFTGDKLNQKKYYHFSNYPGGLKTVKLNQLFQSDPKKVLINAVSHMLPKNRLRGKRLKNINIKP